MRHGRVGQFRRVFSHLHGAVDRGYGVRRPFWDTGRGSSVRLLSETFVVDETSK